MKKISMIHKCENNIIINENIDSARQIIDNGIKNISKNAENIKKCRKLKQLNLNIEQIKQLKQKEADRKKNERLLKNELNQKKLQTIECNKPKPIEKKILMIKI